ncbi:MAG TPA: hypothetical protein PLD25_23165 [Chloroflexota bacterium]|nr:hypothetical protein [Chloroflexota bacterium]HUM72251.1 hypothetical protein [Chloroflexota bacterium]
MSDEIETPPQLFVLRLWQTPLPDGRMEWRGRLHHAQTNETRYFRDWAALIPSLLAMLPPADQTPNEAKPSTPPEW